MIQRDMEYIIKAGEILERHPELPFSVIELAEKIEKIEKDEKKGKIIHYGSGGLC